MIVVLAAMKQQRADVDSASAAVSEPAVDSDPLLAAHTSHTAASLRLPVLMLLGVALRFGVMWLLGVDALSERVEWSVGRSRLKPRHSHLTYCHTLTHSPCMPVAASVSLVSSSPLAWSSSAGVCILGQPSGRPVVG